MKRNCGVVLALITTVAMGCSVSPVRAQSGANTDVDASGDRA